MTGEQVPPRAATERASVIARAPLAGRLRARVARLAVLLGRIGFLSDGPALGRDGIEVGAAWKRPANCE